MAPQRKFDPTLPPGWEALYDDAQRVTYYWNTATGVTTYEKPAGGPPAHAPAPVSSLTSAIKALLCAWGAVEGLAACSV